MRFAEKCLLLAVRERLRLPTVAPDGGVGGGFSASECQIEPFNEAPATVADLYVLVGPLGWKPGPRHGTSGGVRDLVYSVGVFVGKRTTQVPKDRMRDVFALQSGNLNDEIDKVFQTVDWKYEVTTAASATLLQWTASQEGFIHPLVFSGMDAEPRILMGDFFGGKPDSQSGLGRLVRFDGARRITTI